MEGPCPGPERREVEQEGNAEENKEEDYDAVSNPVNPPDEEVDVATRERFIQRALSESARLRKETGKSEQKRDEVRSTMEGGAARMAELTSEHNEEHFSSFACANPAPGAGAENA
ncbi:hypothetical protein GUITHDRAFT_150347 [Guillardia theta CCMP2712]|uniref:Uncharacterized protein n=1 Tax=Guillardia theta (strain CCMP2712) TaxID=905079 RepID=L1JYD1_GUITC|nr:hypothetical protein GUITHDRAFT_150347 [Guillardia theta CCMP2712]EKX53225.1 hypothetical protein GUITHDRAFT_150347 [Guillardia theta CCMP2712]|eukprot:XP_005840205.1 hypothetical protein GUITHDRAFT_150347 [Guillardia theta CCMP2712]